jgi:hypothetical protein
VQADRGLIVPTRGFVAYEPPEAEPPLRKLILRCKDEPGKSFRVGVWEVRGSAERAANRHRKIFKESEPNIIIECRRLHDVDGWGVIACYLPPGMIRE